MSENVLEIRDLHVRFKLDEGMLDAVNGVDLNIKRGKVLGIVGESGCGKTVMSKSLMGLTAPGKVSGDIYLYESDSVVLEHPINVAKLKENGKDIQKIRGRDIAMIFQEPMAAFSPVHTIGNQMIENIRLHRTKNKVKARQIAIDMLAKVGISNPEQRIDEYVHQLSGGMRQRAMIAMALSCNPTVLIADEPTTALDVTIQAQVLDLMGKMQKESGMSIIYITHDLGVIAEICDEVAVMYLGKVVEQADVMTLFDHPMHPYTQALLRSIPKIENNGRERLYSISGSVPIPINLPKQCPFYERCEQKIPGVCDKAVPEFREAEDGHWVSCFHYQKDNVSAEADVAAEKEENA